MFKHQQSWHYGFGMQAEGGVMSAWGETPKLEFLKEIVYLFLRV